MQLDWKLAPTIRSRSVARAVPLFLLAAVLAIGSTACRPKPPKTTAPTPPEAVTTPPPTEAAAPIADEVAKGLPGDLMELNEHLRREGLLGDVYFALDDAALSESARERLAANGRFLLAHPEFEVTIEGHCDERATGEYNLALGERRAATAVGYLRTMGIDQDRLRTVSYGEERPACTSSEESCWSRNRRAHFVITGRTVGN